MNWYYFLRKFTNCFFLNHSAEVVRGRWRPILDFPSPEATLSFAFMLLPFLFSFSFSLLLFSQQHFRRWKFRPAASEHGASPIQRPCAYSVRVEEGRLLHFTVDYHSSFHGKHKHVATVVWILFTHGAVYEGVVDIARHSMWIKP